MSSCYGTDLLAQHDHIHAFRSHISGPMAEGPGVGCSQGNLMERTEKHKLGVGQEGTSQSLDLTSKYRGKRTGSQDS